jgi:tight adherence protein B
MIMDAVFIVFFLLVFISVFLLFRAATSQLIFSRRNARAIDQVVSVERDSDISSRLSFLRRPQLQKLSGIERAIEERSELRRLRRLIDQAGLEMPVYRPLLYSAVFAAIGFGVMLLLPLGWWVAVAVALAVASLPILVLLWLRARRIARIEMQLADAVDMVKRSLRAGNPLVSTFRLVSDSMSAPIAREFGIAAADLSYGSDPRSALLEMLDRVPSLPLRGFVTAILVQRETGGNLAEALDHISKLMRQRFRFERKLRTLSAEGRLSAWILIAIPFVLAAVLYITSPNYLGQLIEDPRGPTLIAGGAILMAIGAVWIRRISRVVI